MTSDQDIIEATRCWIETVVVKNDFCPFAGQVVLDSSLRSPCGRSTRQALLPGMRRNDGEHEKDDRTADRVLYRVVRSTGIEDSLEALGEICLQLDAEPDRETALLIFPEAFAGFEDYLDLVDLAERLLQMQGYEGIYQLASFHPDYLFAGADPDDAANYTNRSPYPMLHLLRESSIERALQHYPAAEAIPERNIETARRIGLKGMQDALKVCRSDKNTR